MSGIPEKRKAMSDSLDTGTGIVIWTLRDGPKLELLAHTSGTHAIPRSVEIRHAGGRG